jgi:hypothetical protein
MENDDRKLLENLLVNRHEKLTLNPNLEVESFFRKQNWLSKVPKNLKNNLSNTPGRTMAINPAPGMEGQHHRR